VFHTLRQRVDCITGIEQSAVVSAPAPNKYLPPPENASPFLNY
jgi:hypothetical protein